ncbi:CWF19-like protein 2, partial [Lecanoromycetidae sp. Uapishka_2]
MPLEDFEKSLLEGRKREEKEKPRHKYDEHRRHHRHHGHHGDHEEGSHRHKRRRRSEDDNDREHSHHARRKHHRREDRNDSIPDEDEEGIQRVDPATMSPSQGVAHTGLDGHAQRDSWMEEPSGLHIDYTQKGVRKPSQSMATRPAKADFELKIHENELNKIHLQDMVDGKVMEDENVDEDAQREVDYTFGDAGAQWRMTKLKGIYRRATETGRPVEEVAEEHYGNLQAFDDAREEQVELDRRETYGEGYVGKEKPSGELFEGRKLKAGIRKSHASQNDNDVQRVDLARAIDIEEPARSTVFLDQTALNRLKAQMMKAKLRGSHNAASLEAEYNNAMARFANHKQADVVVLGAMDNRMLAGGRSGEVTSTENRRGRERGLVEENEDMSIEDMVKQERRTRNQAGGDGQRFAETIAKDAKFDNDLEYMDENAKKLAKRVQKSEINLKNTAISDFQKMNKILDSCPLCHHEDTNTPPVAPVLSLATRVYLTLPTEPEISDGGACIIPIQHRGNLLECDDDEWEEIRNFMKSLTRMYHDQGRDVIFYENAATPQRKKHAGMEVVPLPYSLGETAPAFFKEAILTSDEEWTQHKKLIDTLSKSKQGVGKLAFRRMIAKEMPYFHVWFEIDGGLGHIVEDTNRWPKGDLFAREIIGGMLDVAPDVVKRQGRWTKGVDRRVEGFRKRWRKFDWTRVLTDS